MAHVPQGLTGPALAPGGLRAWLGRGRLGRARVLDRLVAELLQERERWPLWLPVALGAGIALYFALPAEPPAWLMALPILPFALLLLGRRARRGPAHPAEPLLLALALAALGFAAAQIRTQQVEAPVLERRGAYLVEGRVALVEDGVRGQRLLLGEVTVEGVAPESTPALIRFSVRDKERALWPGDRVRARVMLMSPSPPAAPGDFDFARHAFFIRLGAVGYALGALHEVVPAERMALIEVVPQLRQHLASAINDAAPGDAGAVGNAMLTGLRAALSDAVWRDMQIAGIAHLLSISGLHLSLVAGTVFFSARLLIALVPPLALRVPGKKLAAAVALAAALAYLLISGAPVPTQRAFIMTALMLLAVMLDRNPFSMRLITSAAFLVLMLQPESLLGASFQMSFAAVVALIAAYETGVGKGPAGARGLDWRLVMYVAGVALTTLVASLATAPFSAYHFNRLPTYGVVANLIAVPVTGFWIMPLGMLGMLLVPLGLGWVAFVPMGWGIEFVMRLATAVARLPGASLVVPELPDLALVAIVLGGLWLCLWRRPWRRLGLVGVLGGSVLAFAVDLPDLLVDQRGQLIAVRLADGRLALAPFERDRWVTERWLARAGQEEPAPWPQPGAAEGELRCDPSGCVLERAGRRVALTRALDALEEDCARADLVVSYPRIERCPGATPLIGPQALRDAGGMALWIDQGGILRRTVREARGERPWAP